MKNRNPFLLGIISCGLSSIACLMICVFAIINGDVLKAIIELCLSVVVLIFLGYAIGKFGQYREFWNSLREFNSYLQMLIEKENEPFKEFENNGESSSRKV